MIDVLDAFVDGPSSGALRVGLVVPSSGPLGLTGPAALACAGMAAEEVNAAGGVTGRDLELVPIDAGRHPIEVARDVRALVSAGAIDALCGFHTSDVRRALETTAAGRIPSVFTPPHEGGRRSPGTVLLGEDPGQQLSPVVRALAATGPLRRWALIGNDYIWPQAVHVTATRLLHRAGADVVLTRLVPFGQVEAERLIEELIRERADAVLLSLVGRDLATFNRTFARASPPRTIIRVSGSLDETGLLEADGDSTGELYSAMRWFATDSQSEDFHGRYEQRWGPAAPAVSTYAHGCYEGVQLIARLARSGALRVDTAATVAASLRDRHQRVRLARAEGLELVALP